MKERDFFFSCDDKGGKPAGRISFDLEMEQICDINVTFKEVQVFGLQLPEDSFAYLNYHYSGGYQ